MGYQSPSSCCCSSPPGSDFRTHPLWLTCQPGGLNFAPPPNTYPLPLKLILPGDAALEGLL